MPPPAKRLCNAPRALAVLRGVAQEDRPRGLYPGVTTPPARPALMGSLDTACRDLSTNFDSPTRVLVRASLREMDYEK